jgi:hypothetical protein
MTGVPRNSNLPESQEWEPICASRIPQREASAPNPIQFGWQEWRETTRQARGIGANTSDDDFIPATPTAQATTISHDNPSNYIVQPYKALASYACRSVLEEVTKGGWCARKLGLGPEYPGLQYESENIE